VRKFSQILGGGALLLLLGAPWAYYLGSLGSEALRWIILAATVLWFVTAPFWMLGPGRYRTRRMRARAAAETGRDSSPPTGDNLPD